MILGRGQEIVFVVAKMQLSFISTDVPLLATQLGTLSVSRTPLLVRVVSQP